MKTNKITVIGAGNGGQSIAGHCAALGHSVCLYNIELESLSTILESKTIHLKGALCESGTVEIITDDIKTAVEFADIIMIVTTATAHGIIASKMLPHLKDEQIVVLNPGRTLGLLEVRNIFRQRTDIKIHLAEAQTLVYACRLVSAGEVNVIGVKDKVLLSGLNTEETNYIIEKLKTIYGCFVPAQNLIQTGFENIGAVFHPSVVLFNAATIERNTPFYFYRDMTPNVASFIMKLDQERINVGKAYGVELMSVYDWISYAYPNTWGDTLCERMKNNPAYYDILGPGSIFTRQLTEDIPTGIIPMSELGHVAGVDTPLMNSIISLSSALLGMDFSEKGRTLKNMGLLGMDKDSIIKLIS